MGTAVWTDLAAAVGFLTVIGRGGSLRPGAVAWFPAVGLGLGAGLGVLWWAAGRLWPAAVAGGLVVAGDVVATGMLHLDGLADSADGLVAPMGRARRLAVMAEPTVGAFGVVAVVTVLGLRWAALASGHPGSLAGAVALLAGVWGLGRTVMVGAMTLAPPARPEGLMARFGVARSTGIAGTGVGLLASVGLLVSWRSGPGLVVGSAAVVAGTAVVVLARRRLGGVTGDVLGAAGVVAETVGLVVAVARW
jgi:adenosylcobinamide-GDP ribazoletransferase